MKKRFFRVQLWPPEMHGYQHFSQHKAIDFDLHWWNIQHGIHLVEFSLRIDWKTDHGGVHFMFIFFNLVVEWCFYDGRHWNQVAGRYENDAERAAHIRN